MSCSSGPFFILRISCSFHHYLSHVLCLFCRTLVQPSAEMIYDFLRILLSCLAFSQFFILSLLFSVFSNTTSHFEYYFVTFSFSFLICSHHFPIFCLSSPLSICLSTRLAFVHIFIPASFFLFLPNFFILPCQISF